MGRIPGVCGQSMNFLLLQTLAGADVNVINKLLAAGCKRQ